MSHPRILVVDDDEPILLLMRSILREFRFDPVTASSGEAALEEARAARPDLILLDMKMPGMTGDEAVALIRKEPSLQRVPVIILSGEPLTRAEIESLGADGAIQKPFDLVNLLALIRSYLPSSAPATPGGWHTD